MVPSKGLDALVYGLENRVFSNLGKPILKPKCHVDKVLASFKSRFFEKKPPILAKIRWVEFPYRYAGGKRSLYEMAVKQYLRDGIHRHDATVKMFVKYEKLDYAKAFSEGKLLPPRIISPRPPIYHLVVGAHLLPYEHYVYRCIDSVFKKRVGGVVYPGYACVLKAMDLEEVASQIKAKWHRFRKPIFVGLDCSKFDSHIGRALLKYEHGFYTRLINHPEFRRVIAWQIDSLFVAYCPEGNVRFRHSMRCSGDINTGLGNTLLMAAMVFVAMENFPGVFDFICAGDDAGLFIEDGCQLPDLVSFFDMLGVSLKMEPPVDVLEKIEFCQMHPVFTEAGYVMTRGVRGLTKDVVTVKPLNSEEFYMRWLYTIAQGVLAGNAGVPVVDPFHRRVLQYTGHRKVVSDPTVADGWRHWLRGMRRGDVAVSDRARESFARAYGISPPMQIALEERLFVLPWRGTPQECEPWVQLGNLALSELSD
jgi:hypothetical protein